MMGAARNRFADRSDGGEAIVHDIALSRRAPDTDGMDGTEH